MAEEHFNVIVVGMQHAGVIAAGLLKKRGFKVLLVDHGEDGTGYQQHGWRLPFAPSLLPLSLSSCAWQKVHSELGIESEVKAALRPLDPSFQAILPHHRIDIHRDRRRLHEELSREFPRQSGAIAHFLDRVFITDGEISNLLARAPALPPWGLWSRLKVHALGVRAAHLDAPFDSHDFLAGVPFGHPLRELLFAPLHFFGHLGNQSPSTLHAARLIAQYFGGTATLEGGTSLHELLACALTRAGVEIRRAARIEAIETHHRRLTRLHVLGQSAPVTADFFVANTVAPFCDLLPAGKKPAAFMTGEDQARATGALFCVNFVVATSVIPKGMGEALFLLNGRRAPREGEPRDPPLFLRRYAVTKTNGQMGAALESKAEPCQVLSVACPVVVGDAHERAEVLTRLRNQVRHRVSRVVPFLADFLKTTSALADVGADPGTSAAGQLPDPWRLHPTYTAQLRPLWGVAMRPIRTRYKNLLHCGRDVLPGLGVEGEYLTGLAAAGRLTQVLR